MSMHVKPTCTRPRAAPLAAVRQDQAAFGGNWQVFHSHFPVFAQGLPAAGLDADEYRIAGNLRLPTNCEVGYYLAPWRKARNDSAFTCSPKEKKK